VTAAACGGVACSGAPRDLGLDQGLAARDAVRAAAGGLPLAARLGLLRRGVASSRRDAQRFFPHLSERLAGLARGAGVSRWALEALLARELGGEGAAAGAQAVALSPEGVAAGALLARSLPAGRHRILRRSAPEHDWRSVEVALPWLVPALAGVNERGLAVAALALPAASEDVAECAAPAILLAQDCLQRCDGVLKAIEWCERRPAGGRAALLFADAAGELAEVTVRGAERRVRRARDGVLAGAADATRVAELEKACAGAGGRSSPERLAALVGDGVVLECAAPALVLGGVRHPVVLGA
jgi:hypothetical protein